MRILLDECLGARTRAVLEDLGAEVKWIGDVGHGMDDVEVLSLSTTEQRLIITTDKDFADLVYRDGQPFWGVLLVREGSAVGEEKAAVVGRIVAAEGESLIGAFCVYSRGRLRVRRPGSRRRTVEI